jgi:hypothetical protein
VNATGIPATSTATFNSINNHWISSTAPIVCSGGYACNQTTDLTQCVGTGSTCSDQVTPHGDQCTSSQTFVFSPVVSTKSRVGAGTNEQSLCTTISALDSTAGAACKKDTSYACNYNTSNHTVSCPARTQNSRPNSAAWDIGAYLFVASSAQQTNDSRAGLSFGNQKRGTIAVGGQR